MTRTKKSARNIFSIVLTVAFICLMTAAIIPGVMGAATLVNLGSAGNFSILAGTAITGSANNITGDVSTAATASSMTIAPTEVLAPYHIYAIDAGGPAGSIVDPTLVGNAVADRAAAFTAANGQTGGPGEPISLPAELSGLTLAPGLYATAVPVAISGDVTLDAAGNPNAVWVFQITNAGQSLTTSAGTKVILSNGANASNIFWVDTATTTLGANSVFNGNILAGPGTTTIALGTGATVNGRLLTGKDVTLNYNIVNYPANSSVSHLAPNVTGITPATGVNTSTISITNLAGTGFLTGATVNLTRLGQPSIIATGITVVSPTKITCTFDLTGKIAGQYNVTVTNTDGNYGTLTNGFTVSSSSAPVANFAGTPTSGTAPLTVTFTDSSTNTPTSWSWAFGDSTTSTLQSPSHTYSTDGTYTVSLTATNAGGSNTLTRTNYIVVSSVPPVVTPPVALFTGTPISGTVPLTVIFTDLSTNVPTSWSWNLGNIFNVVTQNPTSTYLTPGNYSVSLTVRNAGGTSTLERPNYIVVLAAPVTPPVANFTGTPTSGSAPLSVWFNGTSTNVPTSRAWNFGDGSIVNLSVQNLTHVYLIPGNYTVNLTATNAGGSNTSTKVNYITVTGTPVSHPVANFVTDPASGTAPLTVNFNDTSSTVAPIVSWAWNFGDGGTSTVQNPSHIYLSVGSYTVRLMITDQNGSTNTSIVTNAINVNQGVPIAAFTYYPSIGPKPLSVHFTGNSSYNESIVSRLWQFGDGNSATGLNPVNTYTNAGSYSVTYNVTDQYGHSSSVIHNNAITVTSSPPDGVDLGLAGNYAILSKSGISTTGTTMVTGNMGVSPIAATAITGFTLSMDPSNQFSTSPLVVGRVYAADYASPTPATLTTSVSNMETAYTDAAGRAPDATELYAGNLGGKTLAPGVYKWSTGVLIPTSTTLTLDAQGNSNAVWIFEVSQDLTMDTASQVVLANSAKPENIYWQIGGGTGVTIEAGAHAKGNILALKAITMKDGATLDGRALAQTAVTLIANTVTMPISTATTSTVGVFRQGTVYLGGSNTNGGLPVNAFNYGMIGDQPVTGKWTGTATANTIGIFRTGMFYLRNTNTAGIADTTFNFGQTGDVPVTGHWSGTGSDTVGIFRNGLFALASSNANGGGTPTYFTYGQANDVPVAGDWTGSGTTRVGIFRNGLWALASSNVNGGGTPTYFIFGQAGDVPITGDWNADGKTEVGVFRNGMVYQATSTGTLSNYFNYGMANDLPVGGYFG